MPGMGELIVILLIVMVVFGANKLPGIGDALGRSIKNFKRASSGDEELEVSKGDAGKKQVTAGKGGKQIEQGSASTGEEDGEWEEVVVRRKKSKKAEG